MRELLLSLLVLAAVGCIHHVHYDAYVANDGVKYYSQVCDQKVGVTGCVDQAVQECERFGGRGALVLDSSSKEFGLPGYKEANKIIPDPSLPPGRMRLTFHCGN